MKSYNNKNWLSVFTFYKQDTLTILWPILLGIGLYTALVDFWLGTRPELMNGVVLKNLGIIHSLLGVVISLLLVFRTNTAYDRWWEGRKLWGALVNASRNFALRLNATLPKEDEMDRKFFASFIGVYAKTLDQHLKSEALALMLDEDDHPELVNFNFSAHGPNEIAARMHERLYELARSGKLSQEELITMSQDLGAFTDICGGCERIKNTPIPYSYASFIKKVILLFILTLPWSIAANLGFWSVLVVVFVMYAFASLEVIAEEIEEPFGFDANDLPTGKIAGNISRNVRGILGIE